MGQGTFEIDYTGGFDLSDDFFLGINAAYFDGGDDDLVFMVLHFILNMLLQIVSP